MALALAAGGCGNESAGPGQEGAKDDEEIGQITQHVRNVATPRLTMSASPAAQDNRFGSFVALDENIGVATSVPRTGAPATYVFGGFATGVAARPQKVLIDNVPAADPYLMAFSVGWGRVNNDDYADLIAGGQYRTVTGLELAGGISVYPGSSTGLNSAFRTLLDRATDGDIDPKTDARAFDTFGAAVATGDFDDDGFDDVAVGAPGDAASPGGGVQVFSGMSSGIGPRKTLLPYLPAMVHRRYHSQSGFRAPQASKREVASSGSGANAAQTRAAWTLHCSMSART